VVSSYLYYLMIFIIGMLSSSLVYRDTKPQNAGFDVRGDVKVNILHCSAACFLTFSLKFWFFQLFDFGFVKELSDDLRDKESGQYKLTPFTGSIPVSRCFFNAMQFGLGCWHLMQILLEHHQYMAPEVFTGKPYGKPSDVYSFGVLLWEMLHFKYAVSRLFCRILVFLDLTLFVHPLVLSLG
jgi:serine/threonine protein kinase